MRSGCYTTTYKITLNRYDRDYFRTAIQQPPDTAQQPIPELESHRLIARSRQFFEQQFEAKYESIGGGNEAFRWALRIQDILTNHVSVVVVQSEDEDNAATVFETLNDRGIGLSTPDLLRNLIIRRAREEAHS